MNLYYTLRCINRQEKLEKEKNEAISKHYENMKKHSYRKKLKNAKKTLKSKQVCESRKI